VAPRIDSPTGAGSRDVVAVALGGVQLEEVEEGEAAGEAVCELPGDVSDRYSVLPVVSTGLDLHVRDCPNHARQCLHLWDCGADDEA